MTTIIKQRRYTLDEYLEMEYHSQRRHYYYKGIVAPMTYTSDNHGLIVADIYYLVKFAPNQEDQA